MASKKTVAPPPAVPLPPQAAPAQAPSIPLPEAHIIERAAQSIQKLDSIRNTVVTERKQPATAVEAYRAELRTLNGLVDTIISDLHADRMYYNLVAAADFLPSVPGVLTADVSQLLATPASERDPLYSYFLGSLEEMALTLNADAPFRTQSMQHTLNLARLRSMPKIANAEAGKILESIVPYCVPQPEKKEGRINGLFSSRYEVRDDGFTLRLKGSFKDLNEVVALGLASGFARLEFPIPRNIDMIDIRYALQNEIGRISTNFVAEDTTYFGVDLLAFNPDADEKGDIFGSNDPDNFASISNSYSITGAYVGTWRNESCARIIATRETDIYDPIRFTVLTSVADTRFMTKYEASIVDALMTGASGSPKSIFDAVPDAFAITVSRQAKMTRAVAKEYLVRDKLLAPEDR